LACSGASAPHGSLGTWTNRLLHDSIKPIKHAKINLTVSNKLSLQEFKSIKAAAFLHNTPGIADNIDKDRILTKYTDSCRICGIRVQVATTTKGETIKHQYPRYHQLIKECTMHPSHNLQYRVTRLWLEDVIVEILKANFFEEQDLKNLEELLGTHSKDWTGGLPLYKEMISDF
jgi:hypothetical protein